MAEIKKKPQPEVKKKKPQEKPKQKSWHIITVHAYAPIIANFRVFAEDEEDAFNMLERRQVQIDGRPEIDLRTMKKKRVTIKNTLGGLVNWVRNF